MINIETYRKHRAEGVPACYAYQWAKAETKPYSDPDDLPEGWEIKFKIEPDDLPITDWIGTFTDKPTGFAFKRSADERFGRYSNVGEYRYFQPATSPEEHRRELRKTHGKHEAWLMGMQYARRDWKLAEEHASGQRCQYWVGCRVMLVGHELGSAGLGGIDVEGGEDDPYFEEVKRDLAAEALDEARKEAARLCAKLCASRPSGGMTRTQRGEAGYGQ